MKKTKTEFTTITLTRKEVTEILITHFKGKNTGTYSVDYYIEDVYDYDGPGALPDTQLTKVVVTERKNLK